MLLRRAGPSTSLSARPCAAPIRPARGTSWFLGSAGRISLVVLLEKRSIDVSSMLRRVQETFVFWANSSAGTQL